MVVTLLRPFLTPWPHIILLFNLKSTALRSMFLALKMEVCLLSTTGRDLQQITGSNSSKVGYLSMEEIKELGALDQQLQRMHNENIPTIEEALTLVSGSVKQVILDAKVGPPTYERGLAKDILSIVKRTHCKNCLIWAKNDNLARDIIRISSNVTVGYIVMKDPATGERSNLLRVKGASVVGVYHQLINEKLVRTLHQRHRKVYAWTVDDEDSMKKMLFERVDAIVSSNPTLVQNLMQNLRTQCLEDGFLLS